MKANRFTATVVLGLLTTMLFAASPADSFHGDSRGTPRLVFEPPFAVSPSGSPEKTARAYLRANRDLYRLPAQDSDLVLSSTQESLTAYHLRFQQVLDGIPVENAEIVVSVSLADGSITKVSNNIWPVAAGDMRAVPRIGGEEALDIAWKDLRVHGPLKRWIPTATLVWEPSDEGFHLIWKTFIPVEAPRGEWEHRIDAESGEIRSVRRTELVRKPVEEKVDFASWAGPVLDRASATAEVRRRLEAEARMAEAPSAVADGSGKTFDPDPRTTLNDNTLQDASAIPAGAYFTKTLREITLTSGTYSLTGPWVKIENSESPNTAPSTTTTGIWTATRGNNAFNDSMTYFHLDQNQRYIQSLGFTGAKGIQQLSIGADSDGLSGADNSHYSPGTNKLAFGHGCVDDNEDADVILHEYGHAIHHSINPSTWTGGDTGAMGEGFGDYWAGSYSYSTPNGPIFHPEWVYSWDGHGPTDACWPGRLMDQTQYCYNHSSNYGAHQVVGGVDGDQLWATPLFQALVNAMAQGIPRTEMDQIVLESHFGLASGAKMRDLANATLAAATRLYPSGNHRTIFETAFIDVCILTQPTMATPSLTYPQGGETLTAGAPTTITWNRNGGPSTATYLVQYTTQCTPTVTFADNVEGAEKFTNAVVTSTAGWTGWNISTANAHSPTKSWFIVDPTKKAQARLTLNSGIVVPTGGILSFWHNYVTEGGWDGGVVEISTNGGGAWADLGPKITQGGYSGTLGTGSGLAGRSAFTGSSGGWIETRVDLSSYAGQSVLVRFNFASDGSTGATGWYIDDISFAAAGAWTTIGTSAAGASSLGWTPPGTPGTDYCVRIIGSATGYNSPPTVSGSPFSLVAPAVGATPVPDGSALRPGTPMKGVRNGASVDITWTPTCTAAGYNLYTGSLTNFTAVTGGSCGLGSSGSVTRAIADNSWWIIVSYADATKVGSLGLKQPVAERTLTGWTGVCTQTQQDTSGSCP